MRNATKVAAVLAALATLPASTVGAKSVSLSEARRAPDHVAILKPGQSVPAGVCRDEASDVSAYTWKGGTFGQQQRTRTGFRWHGVRGYVVLRTDVRDGPGRWVNRTARPVLVVTWCG